MSLFRLIHIIAPFITLLVGLYTYKQLNKELKMLFYYVAVGFCTEIFIWLLLKAGVKNNTPGLHFYIMFEFMIWAFFYMQCLKGFVHKKYIIVVTVLFEVYCIINMFFIQDLKSYPFTRTIEDLLMVLFAVLFYTKVISDARIENLSKSPFIWINSSVLLYFTGNFFYNLMFVYMLNVDRMFILSTAVYIFGLFNSLYYFGIAIGFLLHRKYSSVYLKNTMR